MFVYSFSFLNPPIKLKKAPSLVRASTEELNLKTLKITDVFQNVFKEFNS